MPHDKILASFLALGLLTACTTLPGSSGEPATGSVTLEFRPRFKDGGYATLATVDRNTADAIDHLTVTLQRKAPAEEAAAVLVVPQANIWDTIRFSNLKANSTYWLEVKAYKAANETLPSNLISEPASTSIVVDADDEAISLEDDDLEITLKDVVFNGSGEASLNVSEGDYMTPGPATITLGNE